jgi:ABC-type nitrate/sulfonate/bicarbonate transport system substrate-binding protein
MGQMVRLGFLPLIDAAPIIAARECGYFREEGLSVTLHRQVGWANVRDKLLFGHIDAAHALLGMPLLSYLGRDGFSELLVSVMELGCGGNAITVSRELHEGGVKSASDLAEALKWSLGPQRLMGHVFGSSMHHYLLRDWLASGGIDPDRDVRLCVIPPPQMTEHMRGGYLDLFCVGEPWNTAAAREGVGVTLLATTDILPRHPEKVLAVSRRFAEQSGGLDGSVMTGLVRAVLRGSMWCAEAVRRGGEDLAEMLARPEYITLPRELLRESLSAGRESAVGGPTGRIRRGARLAPSFEPALSGGTFPNKMHGVWMLREMVRWGHLHREADLRTIAERCCDTRAYRAAARTLDIVCPPEGEDFVEMELRGGRKLRLADLNKERLVPSPARVA